MILLFRNCQHFLLSTKSSLWPWRLFIMWPSNYLFSFLSLSLSLTFLFAEDIPPKTEVMLFVMFTQLFSILSVFHVFLSILTASALYMYWNLIHISRLISNPVLCVKPSPALLTRCDIILLYGTSFMAVV